MGKDFFGDAMLLIHPSGHLVSSQPFLLDVKYALPFAEAVGPLARPEIEHKLRAAYTSERLKNRSKGSQVIPVWIFCSTVVLRREEVIDLFVKKDLRSLTYTEIAALAKVHSVMDRYNRGQQTVTVALGSGFPGEDRGKKCLMGVSYMETPLSLQRSTGSWRKQLGFSSGLHGYGEGCYFPATESNL